MSWGNLFDDDKEEEVESKGILNRPVRHPDVPARPAPTPPKDQPAEPWFVGPEPNIKRNTNTKSVIKRTVGILFPIAALLVLIGIIIMVVDLVAKSYG